MMTDAKNHYEVLELCPNASIASIERMFRFLATKMHPDAGGDKEEFSRLVKAFEVIRDPSTRTAYDAELANQNQQNDHLVEHAAQAGNDVVDRHQILCLFYARRRQTGNQPALGTMTVGKMMDVSEEVLDFHLWYFREKGWIKREEDGGYAITAEGVDKVEASEIQLATQLRIEAQPQPSFENAVTHAMPATV